MSETFGGTDLSFIIPSFNAFGTIGRTVGSILAQTRRDAVREIIVVDSSGDKRMEGAMAAFASEPGVVFLRLPRKTAPGAARNIGAEQAYGTVLCFVDSDVVLADDWAENVIKAYEKGCLAGGGSVAVADLQWKSPLTQAQFYLQLNEYLDHGGPRAMRVVPACNMFCGRKLFQEAGGFPYIRASEDSLFCLKLNERALVWFIPRARCVHIFREGVSDFFRNQRLLGEHTFLYRQDYYKSWFYQGLWPAILLPAFVTLKFCWIVGRVARAGPKYWPSFLGSLPFFLAGLVSWAGGFRQGVLQKAADHGSARGQA